MKSKSILAASIASIFPMGRGEGETIQMSYATEAEVPTAFKSLYTEQNGAWALTGVVGMKTQDDVNSVMSALNKERNDRKALAAKYAPLGDREVSTILADLDRIPALEAGAKGSDAEAIEAQVAARVEQATAPLKRDITTLTTERDDLNTQVQGFQQANTLRTVSDSLRSAATKAKVLPEAIDDIVALGQGLFEAGDNGVIAKTDLKGVTAGIAPEVWLTEIKRSKPYFFPATQGAGGRGGQGGQGGTNPFSKENWNMTEQGRLVNSDRALAEQMAKNAGTHIGGPMPE